MDAHRDRRGLLDTSTLILLGQVRPEQLPEEPLISTITLAELSVGPLVADEPEEASARQAHLQQAESDFDALPFDEAAARAFGRVATALRGSGRKPAARAYDALIAAIAVAGGLPIYTANPRDFRNIPALVVRPVEVSAHEA